jgi:hypothetical protein
MWDFILHRVFGVGGESTGQIRFGAGVVALTTSAVITFCAAAGGVAWALSKDPYLALAVVGIMAAVVVTFFLGTWRFADKHPDQAALGGTSYLRLRELQGRLLEAKGQPEIPTLPSTTDPLKPLPTPAKLLDAPDDE